MKRAVLLLRVIELLTANCTPWSRPKDVRGKTAPMIPVAAGRVMRSAGGTTSTQAHHDVTEFFLQKLDDRTTVDDRGAANTKAKLSSTVLKDILLTLGLDYRLFETKANLMDLSLRDRRNRMAHGEYIEISGERFIDLSPQVVDLLEEFRNQASSAAVLRTYWRAA
jgi:hypothetical protein